LTIIQALIKLEQGTEAEVFITGGFVRDYMRNKNNNDLDVVVRKLSLKNIRRFLKQCGDVKEVKLSKTNDKIDINILLFKVAGDSAEAQISLPKKGKHHIADIDNTLIDDAMTRDFRINALYLPIKFKSKKDVIDLTGGCKDIANRIIVSNGSPRKRFKESPIRMMRAISLAARMQYDIDRNILQEIKNMAHTITSVPYELIRNELNKILLCKKPSVPLKLLRNTGLLKFIAPEINNLVGVTQDKRYHQYDVFTHVIYTCDSIEPTIIMRLAGLLHDIGKAETRAETFDAGKNLTKISFHKHEAIGVILARNFLRRMKYDNDTIKSVVELVRNHMYYYTTKWTNSAVRKFIKRVGITSDYVDETKISTFPLFKLRMAERKGSGNKATLITEHQKDFEKRILDTYKESKGLTITELDINGNVLMDVFNLKPGIQIGNILSFLLDKVLEKPEVNNRLSLLKLATEYIHLNNVAKKELQSCST